MRTCTCNFDELHVVLVTDIQRGERRFMFATMFDRIRCDLLLPVH